MPNRLSALSAFDAGVASYRQRERERLADQEMRAQLERGNRFRELAPRAFTAATPDDRRQVLGEIAAVNPDAAMQFDRQFVSREEQVRTQLGNAARALTRIPRDKQTARAQVYQMMLPDLRAMGLQAPDQYGPDVEDIAESLAALDGEQQPEFRLRTEEGPFGSKIVSDGSRFQVIEQPQPNAPRAPVGYRFTPDGQMEPIPGGPGDPGGPNTQRRGSTDLRKEFNSLQAVKDYRSVLPIVQRAATAPDTRAGDVSVIYALGKVFDPGSVVREGELVLSQDAAPWLQKLTSSAASQVAGTGRLSPAVRKQIMEALRGQVDSLSDLYRQARSDYQSYAIGYGLDPAQVLGSDPADAFPSEDQQTQNVRTIGGKQYVQVNGEWFEQE